jgi:hypothetical protein
MARLHRRKTVKTRRLPCKLTDQERQFKGDQLVQKMHAMEEAEDLFEVIRDSHKTRIKEFEKEISVLSRVIRERSEERDVEVTEDKDYESKTAKTIRLDTGDVVDSRPLSPQELQRPIPFNPSLPMDTPAQENSETTEEKPRRGRKRHQEKVAVGE